MLLLMVNWISMLNFNAEFQCWISMPNFNESLSIHAYIHTSVSPHALPCPQDLHHSLRSLSKFFTGRFSYPVVIFHDMLTRYTYILVCAREWEWLRVCVCVSVIYVHVFVWILIRLHKLASSLIQIQDTPTTRMHESTVLNPWLRSHTPLHTFIHASTHCQLEWDHTDCGIQRDVTAAIRTHHTRLPERHARGKSQAGAWEANARWALVGQGLQAHVSLLFVWLLFPRGVHVVWCTIAVVPWRRCRMCVTRSFCFRVEF